MIDAIGRRLFTPEPASSRQPPLLFIIFIAEPAISRRHSHDIYAPLITYT
jgi:hypothetical protein